MTTDTPVPATLAFTNAPETLYKGMGARIAFTVSDADSAAIDNEGVMFEFVPTTIAASETATTQATVPTSANTFVEAGPDGYAYVWIGSDETAPELTVQGTCVDADASGDPVTATFTATVTDASA